MTRKSRLARLFHYALAALVMVIVISIGLTLPLRWANPSTTAFILQDTSGRVPVAWEWQAWDRLGSQAPLAVVAAEDQKFATHFGFDVASIADSVADFSDGERLRGASTISQQVAKNLYLWPDRSYLRKGLEAWMTLFIELTLPKRRILEIYLNVAEFGPGIYGIPAASRLYFGKPPVALYRNEAALLAAVLPSPRRMNAAKPSSYVRRRQRWIVDHMARLQREQWLMRLD